VCDKVAHPKWAEFNTMIMNVTEGQQRFGMGIRIAEARNTLTSLTSLMMMSPTDFKAEGSSY
jgi:hypothetical protein